MYFISYSRQQFYYAEYLVYELEARGIKVWFDVQELVIGRDWQGDLNNGLNTCAGLILIASRASIESPYVEYEWKFAIERKIPIYVVVFESVSLPKELMNVAKLIVHYQSALPLIIKFIRSDISSDSIFLPTQRVIFAWIPRDVMIVSLTVLLSAIYHLVGAFAVEWSGIISRILLQIVFVSLCILLLYQAWKFIKRTFDFDNLINSLIFFNTLGFVSYTQLIFPNSARLTVNFTIYLLTIVLIPLMFYTLFLMLRSSELLWWTTTGEAPETLRLWQYPRLRKFREEISRLPPANTQQSIRFRIWSSRNDMPLASHITMALIKAGHLYVLEDADYHLLIISDHTEPDDLRTFLKSTNRIISIVTNSVHIPDGLEALKRYQWVDYRKQSATQLRGLVAFFNHGAEAYSTKLLNNVPESMGRIAIPSSIQLIILVLRIIAAICIVTGAITGLSALVNLPNGNITAFLGVPIGIVLLRLATQILQRTITKYALVTYTVGLFLSAMVVLPEIAALIFVVKLLIAGSMLKVWKHLHWFPHSKFRPVATMTSIKPRPIWIVNALMVLLGVWAVLFTPGIEAAGLMELIGFQLGLTGYHSISLEGISINVPNYFQLASDPTTPHHLDDIGSVIWQGRSTTGISPGNAITLRIMRYLPKTSETVFPADAGLFAHAGGLPIDVPTDDPFATIDFYLNKNFRPLVEQIHAPYYSDLIMHQFQVNSISRQTQQDAVASQSIVVMPNPPVNLAQLPPPEPKREVQSVVREQSILGNRNISINRVSYDLLSEGSQTHEWLIPLETNGPDYILHIEGKEEAIEWHISQIRYFLDSLVIDESFREPLVHEVQVEGAIFKTPRETIHDSYSFNDSLLQQQTRGLQNVTLDAKFFDHLFMHHNETYNFEGEAVRLRIYTSPSDYEYANANELITEIQKYVAEYPVVQTTFNYTDIQPGGVLDENGEIRYSQELAAVFNATRTLQFSAQRITAGHLSNGTPYKLIQVYTHYPFSSFDYDEFVIFDHQNKIYVIRIDGATDEFFEQFLADLRFLQEE